MTKMEEFKTGATRSDAANRPDYSGYLSPLAHRLFGRYMLRHQVRADGKRRSSHNWKKGMPIARYVESLSRHYEDFIEAWDAITIYGAGEIPAYEQLEEALGGLMFNVQGFAHELEKGEQPIGRSAEPEKKGA